MASVDKDADSSRIAVAKLMRRIEIIELQYMVFPLLKFMNPLFSKRNREGQAISNRALPTI